MSFNRENVIWQSADGTWNRAFYEVLWTGDDPEWDVEYGDGFGWVATGLRSEEAAEDSWHGANPGGWTILRQPDDADACARMDAKRAEFLAARSAR